MKLRFRGGVQPALSGDGRIMVTISRRTKDIRLWRFSCPDNTRPWCPNTTYGRIWFHILPCLYEPRPLYLHILTETSTSDFQSIDTPICSSRHATSGLSESYRTAYPYASYSSRGVAVAPSLVTSSHMTFYEAPRVTSPSHNVL